MKPDPLLPRRDFFHALGLTALAGATGQLGLSSTAVWAQQAAAVEATPLPPLNRFPRLLQDWLVAEVRASEARGQKRREAVKTKADAEAYVADVQQRIRQCFGPMPEKTPLQARVTQTLMRDGYRVENILFESRPQYLVTGNLYLPTSAGQAVPGVIGLCGHSLNGKAAEAYQSFAQGLARQGMACFIIDPVGQGERFQYLNDQRRSRLGGGTTEHNQMGNPQVLVGEVLAGWFAWDAIRALDYLLTRPEIDPHHIGVTGNSGGGTQTTWLCGLEPRFTMAAPSCFVTTFRRDAENELPQDCEQCPPGVLARDLDHADFLAAMAPKPVIILAQEKDYFDARGSMEAFGRLKHLYTLLGHPDNIQLHIGPDPHGYSLSNREAMYRFFGKVTRLPGMGREPVLKLEQDADLQCTPQGQVADLGSKTLMAFTADKARALAARRPGLKGEALASAVREVLKLPALPAEAPDYRILRHAGARRYPGKEYCTYAVETAAIGQALVTRLSAEPLTSRLPRGAKRALLYVAHQSVDAELREEALVRELIAAEPDAAFFACDVRGIGESQPNTCGVNQFLRPYGSHYFYAAYGQMLDQPLLGQRTWDVLRVLQLLVRAGHTEIHLVGRGWGALPATLAALLSDAVVQVTLKQSLTSFHELAVQEDHHWPYAAMLFGVLERWDLPDCYRALEAKRLRQLEPMGAQGAVK